MLFAVSPKRSTRSSAWPCSSSGTLLSAIRHSRRASRLTKKSLILGILSRSAFDRFQPPLDIQQHPTGVGDRFHRLDDQVPRHLIEEPPDIQIDDPVVLPAPTPAHPDRFL